MSKVIVFYCSPRKNGYTAKLMEQVIEGAKSAGAEIVSYDLNAEGVKGCQGCFACRSFKGCATRDLLQPMYEDLKDATGIVAGFPIYFGAVSGQGKILLDRLYPMVGDQFQPRFPGKKVVTVFAQANPDSKLFAGAMESTHNFFKLCGWEILENLLIYGDVDPDFTLSQELLDRAYEAGKRLGEKC